MLNKKTISPVVATAILLVVAVISVVGFESWFGSYSSDVLTGVENKGDDSSVIRVDGIVGGELYVYSGSDESFSFLKIVDSLGVEMCQVGSDSLDSNIVAYWRMDGDGLDNTTNGNDGVVTGASYNASGQVDGMYEFDGGNDYITVPHSTDFDFLNTAEFSISMWLKSNGDCTSPNGDDVFATKFGAGHADATWWFGCSQTFETVKLWIFDDDADSHNLYGTTPLNDSLWHNVGWVYDGVNREVKVFVDGNFEKNETLILATDFNYPTVFCIGGYGAGASCSDFDFDGEIDDFKVWNKSLNGADISNLYLNKPANLKALSGVSSYDVSSCSLSSGEVYNVVGFTDSSKVDMKVIVK